MDYDFEKPIAKEVAAMWGEILSAQEQVVLAFETRGHAIKYSIELSLYRKANASVLGDDDGTVLDMREWTIGKPWPKGDDAQSWYLTIIKKKSREPKYRIVSRK